MRQLSQHAGATPFAKMRSATGGDAWNGVSQANLLGKAAISGLHGSVRIDDDLVHGRYAQYFNISARGHTAEIYDGATVWNQDASGGIHPYDTEFARKRAITSAYLTRRGYFERPATATITCLGTRLDEGRSVTLIRATSRRCPGNLAIDSHTYLLRSITMKYPLALDDGVTRYADYRSVDGLVLPFSILLGTQADPTDGYAIAVTEYHLHPNVRATDFNKPAGAGQRLDNRPGEINDGANAP